MSDYLGHLQAGFSPYDPLELLRQTEEKVCRGEARKYTAFYCASVYGDATRAHPVSRCRAARPTLWRCWRF